MEGLSQSRASSEKEPWSSSPFPATRNWRPVWQRGLMGHTEGTILVVDDDAVARDLLVEALRKEGYDVEAAADGTDAIARGRERRFDLVLTDFRMGVVDGIAVLREFKQCSPDTSIVLLTAFGSMEGAIEAIRQGAYDYLAKPFKKEEIKLIVRRSLEHSRLVRENARFRGSCAGDRSWHSSSAAARPCWRCISWSRACRSARAPCS